MSPLIRYLLTLLAMLSPHQCIAQKLVVTDATRTDWAGGIAGRSGTNYTFSFRLNGSAAGFSPDTLWIGSEFVKLVVDSGSRKPFNTRIKNVRGRTFIDITAGTSSDGYDGRLVTRAMQGVAAPIPYKGIAMLSYTLHGRRAYCIVPRIITQYLSVNYP